MATQVERPSPRNASSAADAPVTPKAALLPAIISSLVRVFMMFEYVVCGVMQMVQV